MTILARADEIEYIQPESVPILLVDDEASNTKLLRAMLTLSGFTNLTASNDPLEVLGLCERQNFGLVILDLNMPGLDGFDVMRLLRGMSPEKQPQILVLTAMVQPKYLERALNEGASDYLTKPFNPVELLARTRNLIMVWLYRQSMQARALSLEQGLRERTEELLRSRQRIRELVSHQERVREHERTCVAREIHDELGQYLTALRMDTALLRIKLVTLDPALVERTDAMKDLIDHTITAVRSLATQLRPAALDLGLASAAEWLVHDFSARAGVECLLDIPEKDLELSEDLATATFRILQESLTNVSRHARAGMVEIHIERDADALHMNVRDDGVGFDLQQAGEHKTYGLMGIRERAIMLGGEVHIVSSPGAGTNLTVRLPLFENPAALASTVTRQP